MSILLTGGAGFIGSCILGMLNKNNRKDVIIVDNISSSNKWLNIRDKEYLKYYNKHEFLCKLSEIEDIELIIHMGACSSTKEDNFDYLYKNNIEFSQTLYKYAAEKDIAFIYASSAATYGDGSNKFDDTEKLSKYLPLNRYGYSKHFFDIWNNRQKKKPKQVVGLKFFNVYGPNEYAKNDMASVVYHAYNQVMKYNEIKLFKSYKENYSDGEQLRDFVYVKDILNVIKFFMDKPEISGIFNVGTGKAESFNTLALSIFKTLKLKKNVKYIDMPIELRDKYQYFTQADMSKLKKIGFNQKFYSLEEGIKDYIENYLKKDFRNY